MAPAGDDDAGRRLPGPGGGGQQPTEPELTGDGTWPNGWPLPYYPTGPGSEFQPGSYPSYPGYPQPTAYGWQPPAYWPPGYAPADAPPGYPPGYTPAGAYGKGIRGGYGYGQHPWGTGELGRIRSTGRTVLFVVVTLGIFIFVFNYKVHSEMKRYNGRGIGGGVAVLVTFLANFAMPMLTAREVGGLYESRQERPPVSSRTGWWVTGTYFLGNVLLYAGLSLGVSGAQVQPAGTTEQTSPVLHPDAIIGFSIAFGVVSLVGIVVSLLWFVKVNGALNNFWRSRGAIQSY